MEEEKHKKPIFIVPNPPEIGDLGNENFKAGIEKSKVLLESSGLSNVAKYAEGVEAAKFVLDSFGMSKLRGIKYVPGVQLAEAINDTRKHVSNFNVPKGEDKDRILYTSAIGTPVLIDLQLDSPAYQLDGVNYPATSITVLGVLVQVNMHKNIVKTTVQGYDDIIKEYISNGSWNVNIKGVLLGGARQYPKEDFNKILTIGLCPYPIKATSWYLNQYGITSVVVEDPNFPQEEGKYSMQLFEFMCMSDKPIELKLA